MHWHEDLLWIPIKKALRAHNIGIKILFIGHNTRKGIALDNPTALQMLQTPSYRALHSYLVRAQHPVQIPSMLRFTSTMVFRAFIGIS